LWDDLRFLLVVARTGSANRAAVELRVNHTTVGRRIGSLEKRLGLRLVARASGTGLSFTTDGKAVLEAAEQMEQISETLLRRLTTRDNLLSGELRIASSDGIATYWLMNALLPFQQAHPGLRIRWLTNDQTLQVGRDAEIGVNWICPTNPNLIARKLGMIEAQLFSNRAYLDRVGVPRSIEELGQLALLHFDKYETYPTFARWNELMRRFPPAICLDNSVSVEAIIRDGSFIALLPSYTPVIAPDLVRLPIDLGIEADLWLTYHVDQRDHTRIKAVVSEIRRLALAARGTWFKG
jgi:DNA-binding transcriptional LysR family regulator